MLFAAATAAGATTGKAAAQAPAAPSLLGAFFALLLVLALIAGLAWLLRRLPGSGFRPAGGLRVVASVALGAKERAVVVEVGGEQLLLGVAPGSVTALHRLPAALPEAPAPQLPSFKRMPGRLPDFAQLLAQKLRKDS